MDESTKLISDMNAEEKAKVIISETEKSNPRNSLFRNRTAAGAAGLGVGAAAAAGVFALLGATPPAPVDENGETIQQPKPNLEGEPVLATKVTDDMSFSEAYAVARQETGPNGFFVLDGKVYNTLNAEEMAQLTPEERNGHYGDIMDQYGQHHPVQNPVAVTPTTTPSPEITPEAIPILIHDVAPVAELVTEDMSATDAFAVARAEMGPGAIYYHNGAFHNTYTTQEWDIMSDDMRESFRQSVPINSDIAEPFIDEDEIDIVNIDNQSVAPEDIIEPVDGGQQDRLIDQQYVEYEGQQIRVSQFQGEDGVYIAADTDGDGIDDMMFTSDDSGNLTVTDEYGDETVIPYEEVQQIQNETLNEFIQIDNPVVDPVDPDIIDIDPVYPASDDSDVIAFGDDFDPNNDVLNA